MTAHRRAAAEDARVLEELLEQAEGVGAVRDFRAALTEPGLSLIAEVKRRSPSAGDLAADLDPAETAARYASGGAACLSVLTDESYFGGSREDLVAARARVHLPVLRKDFTVDARDVADARLMGADAVLLIVAGLDDDELHAFHALIRQMRMTAVVEVHDEAELRRALTIPDVSVIGVNQRDLHTFTFTDAAERLRDAIPSDVTAVAESGITSVADAQRMADLGYDGILCGSALVTSGDPEAMARSFSTVRSQ